MVDQIDGVSQGLGELDFVVPHAVAALKAGRYTDAESAPRGVFASVCRYIGIRFDDGGPILTWKAAERSAARGLVKGREEFAHAINSDVTSDLTDFHIATPNTHD